MLTEAEKKWLEERKVGMCCRCVHYYTDITDCGVGCQWIANKDFPMLQCFRFWNEDYTIEKGDFRDVAEFEARVAAIMPYVVFKVVAAQAGQKDITIDSWECLKIARLAVEAEMG